MPELPEVETIRRGLVKSVKGQKILALQILNQKIVSSHSNIRKPNQAKANTFIKSVIGKQIIDIERRAKNIIIRLGDGGIILIHLKMTGQLVYGGEPRKHTHLIFTLEHGTLLYNDIRQFGYVLYYNDMSSAVQNGHFALLGPEPFGADFTVEHLAQSLSKKNRTLKSALLDQSIVVGIGNIYADEICFASGISPHRICNSLDHTEVTSLYNHIKSVLALAIAAGGSSISDYKLVNGESGNYQDSHLVYGHAGLPCVHCDTTLSRSIISGRSTVYCTVCQK